MIRQRPPDAHVLGPPSMRRPVGVKGILVSCCSRSFFFPRPFAAVAMLPSALSRSEFVPLGACWASSIQPVLPSVWRPVVLLLQSGTWARPLTQSPELGFGLLSFSLPGTILTLLLPFVLTQLPQLPFGCYGATVRTLL